MKAILVGTAKFLGGRVVPTGGAASVAAMGGLVAAPVLLHLAGHALGPAAEAAALCAAVPCGILAGRVASARSRQRRLRSYWD